MCMCGILKGTNRVQQPNSLWIEAVVGLGLGQGSTPDAPSPPA